nr:uncharacterized protein CI109_007346 [Kwoniella shandongensis]KAA5524333.1 hypothetical protein CI109_007346 [Kwoniella shandongensis]
MSMPSETQDSTSSKPCIARLPGVPRIKTLLDSVTKDVPNPKYVPCAIFYDKMDYHPGKPCAFRAQYRIASRDQDTKAQEFPPHHEFDNCEFRYLSDKSFETVFTEGFRRYLCSLGLASGQNLPDKKWKLGKWDLSAEHEEGQVYLRAAEDEKYSSLHSGSDSTTMSHGKHKFVPDDGMTVQEALDQERNDRPSYFLSEIKQNRGNLNPEEVTSISMLFSLRPSYATTPKPWSVNYFEESQSDLLSEEAFQQTVRTLLPFMDKMVEENVALPHSEEWAVGKYYVHAKATPQDGIPNLAHFDISRV